MIKMTFQSQQQLKKIIEDLLSLEPDILLNYLIKNLPLASYKTVKKTEKSDEKIIFEAEIDGVQYYLVRCQVESDKKIKLSPRELMIAQLISQGFSNKYIGENLKISYWTVNTYLRRIYTKLGVTSRTAMVTRLIAEQIL